MPSAADRAWSRDRHAFLARARGEEVGGAQEGKGAAGQGSGSGSGGGGGGGGAAVASAGGFFGDMLTALSPAVEAVHKELQLENLRILAKPRPREQQQGGARQRQLNFDL